MVKKFQLKLDGKQIRIIRRCLQELFAKSSLEPITDVRRREISFLENLSRRFKVSSEGHEAMMSDAAVLAYRRVVDIFTEVSAVDELCTRNDLNKALREVYETCWQNLQRPDSTEEFIDLLCENVILNQYTIIAGLRGIELREVQEVKLGKLRLISSLKDFLADACVGNEADFEKNSFKHLVEMPCLVGNYTGTLEATQRWYKEQAFLAAGMFAVEAGASYERAATSFQIVPEFERPSGTTGSRYLYWSETEKDLGFGFYFGGSENFSLTAESVSRISKDGMFEHAFEIFQKRNRSELEDAITRAVYWYGDAHRDSAPVMQFIKYWSCLECLLGDTNVALTKSLALGIVAVLSLGEFRRFELSEWDENIRVAKHLYGLRSSAVHRASHSHVELSDVVKLGTWAAWLIYNAISFSKAGMCDLRTLWDKVRDVANQRDQNKA